MLELGLEGLELHRRSERSRVMLKKQDFLVSNSSISTPHHQWVRPWQAHDHSPLVFSDSLQLVLCEVNFRPHICDKTDMPFRLLLQFQKSFQAASVTGANIKNCTHHSHSHSIAVIISEVAMSQIPWGEKHLNCGKCQFDSFPFYFFNHRQRVMYLIGKRNIVGMHTN